VGEPGAGQQYAAIVARALPAVAAVVACVVVVAVDRAWAVDSPEVAVPVGDGAG